jgi:hypothetical protein
MSGEGSNHNYIYVPNLFSAPPNGTADKIVQIGHTWQRHEITDNVKGSCPRQWVLGHGFLVFIYLIYGGEMDDNPQFKKWGNLLVEYLAQKSVSK